MLELAVPGEPQALGDRLRAFAIIRPGQAAQVERRPVLSGLATRRSYERRQTRVQIHRVDTILAQGRLLLLQLGEQRTMPL
ncbi:hypothetical protein DK412_14805 [Methylobacterium sp. 17Sr1-1]|nr:hypothetical protein DK412_14805 [Methylobacterium sp. 17Sr1-1]